MNKILKWYKEATKPEENDLKKKIEDLHHITLRLKEEEGNLKKKLFQLVNEVAWLKEKLRVISRENSKRAQIDKDKDGNS
jgi:predicted RNase H-like nuclease (RuvC/YqgF family)